MDYEVRPSCELALASSFTLEATAATNAAPRPLPSSDSINLNCNNYVKINDEKLAKNS